MIRNDTIKPFIIQIMAMDMSEKDSLKYLADNGFKVSHNHLYRLKRKIKESRFDRLSLIAKHGFVDQHLQRIDQLELINKEYWKLYNDTNEKDTLKKAIILEKIAELQTFISPFYEASKWIMEDSIKSINKDKHETEKGNPISTTE